MVKSKLFDKIKYYYDHNEWSKQKVYNVVAKGVITPLEYEEITGEPYQA